MTVLSSTEGAIVLEGSCSGEDAEILVQQLMTAPTASVDLRRCESAHAAVIQVLMAFKPALLGPAPDTPMWRWVYPVLDAHR